MIPCRVQRLSFGPWLVTLANRPDRTLFFQIDCDQAAFAVSSGAIAAPSDWNGNVESLGPAWEQFDPETIESCPDEYLAVSD
jgi:hypothetical protein